MIDEHLPYNPEVERALLSQILLCDNRLAWISNEEIFYVPEHAAIFKELIKNELNDIVSLSHRLGEAASGELIASLFQGEANAKQGDNYYQILLDQADRRKAILASRTIERLALKPASTLDEILAEAAKIQKTIKQEEEGVTLAADLALDFENWINEVHSGSLKDNGITWGCDGLPEIIDKLRPSELCLIGGPAGSGKTSLANSMVALSCIPAKRPALIFSLEMSKRQEVLRLVSIIGRIPLKKIMTRDAMSPEDLEKFGAALKALNEANFGIEDQILSIDEIAIKAREYKAAHGLELVVIDHAQLIRLRTGRGVNDVNELGGVAKTAKWMSKELECVVILLTQINKADGGPYGADIMRAHCDQFVVIDESSPEDTYKNVHVRKHRNGAIGDCQCSWFGPMAAFYDADKIKEVNI